MNETRKHIDAAINAALRPAPDFDAFVTEAERAAAAVDKANGAADFLRRCEGRWYMFASSFGPMLSPVLAVAVRSRVGESWAAYIAGVPIRAAEDDALAQAVYMNGTKLAETQARGLFPYVKGEYRQ